jgi:hypothetical protein
MGRTCVYVLALVCAAVGSGLLLTAQQPQAVGSWAQMAEHVADSRIGAASAVLPDGRTLIAGGLVDGQPTARVVIFDPVTNSFVGAGEMAAARVGHTATLLDDGRVLIAGGRIADQVVPDLEVFSPHADLEQSSSALIGTMLTARESHAAAKLADGTVLIAGGANAGGPLDTAEIFNPADDTTAETWHPMGTARAGASATLLIDGRVLIAGGTTRDAEGSIRDLARAELFESSQQAFYPTDTNLSVARSGHTAVLLPHNNGVLIAGGSSHGVVVASSDLFLPAEFPDAIAVGMGQFAPAGPMLAARHGAVGGPKGDGGLAFVAGGASVDLDGQPVVSANAESYRFATIMTDKDDYYPGETVFITGSGWQPGETVSLLLQEWENIHSDRVFEPIAEADGTFTASFLVEDHHLGVRFYLTGLGAGSKAQITFTDAPRIGAVTVGAQSPNPLNAINANTATYSVSIERTANGTVNGVMNLSWNSPAPAGITHAFTPQTWTSGGGTNFPTVTLVLTTNGATPAGTYPFTVAAAAGADVSTGGAGTLVVLAPCTAPSITSQPLTAPIVYGSNAVFTAAASGVPTPTVQWQTGGGTAWADIAGETGTTLTLITPPVAMSGSQYRAVFSNNCSGPRTATTDAATLTVGTAAVTGSFTAANKAYDGNTSAVVAGRSLGGAVGEDDVALVGGTATFADVNAGTGKVVSLVGASLSGADAGNYSLASVNTTAADINKTIAAITVIGYTGVYDGAAHGATGTATGVNNEPLSGLDLGASFTDVPGGTANWSFAGDGNYNATSGSVAIAISKADATVSVSGYTGVYDGVAHSATGTAMGVGGASLSGFDLGASFTNVPGGTANWTFTDATGNYNEANGTAAIVISKADATVVVEGFSGVYDGNAHGATGTAMGVGGVSLSGLDLGDSFTNAPGGTATWTFSGGTNYAEQSNSVEIEIAKAASTTAVACAVGPFTYSGAAQTPCTVSVTGAGGLNETPVPVYANNVDAGTASASYSYAASTNHEGSNDSKTFEIGKQTITGSFTAAGKVYDGNTAAEITGRTLNGVFGTDAATLSGGTAAFDSKNAGTRTATLSGAALSGAAADNYSLSSVATATAEITKRALAVSANGVNKPYDGNASASVTLTDDRVSGDELTPAYTSASFDNKNVATGKPVSVSGISISGDDAGNYNPNATAATTANITPKGLTVSATGVSKVYDGTANATVNLGDDRVTGDVLTLAYTSATFNDKKVASGKPVSVSGISVAGADAGNYTANTAAETSANITALAITGGFTAENKTYDATAAATVLTRSTTGRVAGDAVNLTGGTATFDNKNVAASKTVTLAGAALTGEDAANYTLASVNTTTAEIAPLAATLSGARMYDGTTNAPFGILSVANRIGSDAVTVASGNGTLANKNVGSRSITSFGALALGGIDGPNYTLTGGTGAVEITKKNVQLTGARPYDGTATASFGILSVVNRISGDTVTVASGAAPLASKEVGVRSITNFDGLVLGNDADGNYTLLDATGEVAIGSWAATGFYAPIAVGSTFINAPGAAAAAVAPVATSSTLWNVSKGGSSVPLKFDIFRNGPSMPESTNTADVKAFVAQQLSACSAGINDTIDDDSASLALGTGLKYDGEQFHQNWKTPTVKNDTCYRVTVTLQDNTTIHTFIKLKK